MAPSAAGILLATIVNLSVPLSRSPISIVALSGIKPFRSILPAIISPFLETGLLANLEENIIKSGVKIKMAAKNPKAIDFFVDINNIVERVLLNVNEDV